MDINKIGMILCIIIIIAVFIKLLTTKQIYQKNATDEQIMNIYNGDTGTTEQCTYSIWFYVNDWASNYGEEKCIFRSSPTADNVGDLNVYLGKTNNDLTIQIKTLGGNAQAGSTNVSSYQYIGPYNDTGSRAIPKYYSQGVTSVDEAMSIAKSLNATVFGIQNTGQLFYNMDDAKKAIPSAEKYGQSDTTKNTPPYGNASACSNPLGCAWVNQVYVTKSAIGEDYTNCVVQDIELQKWINLTFSINTNSIDIYINGELVKSQILNGVAYIKNTNSVFISPNGKGFNGFNSKFKYWTYYMNPREVKNIYKQGSGSSSSANDTRLNISLYQGDERRANIVI